MVEKLVQWMENCSYYNLISKTLRTTAVLVWHFSPTENTKVYGVLVFFWDIMVKTQGFYALCFTKK